MSEDGAYGIPMVDCSSCGWSGFTEEAISLGEERKMNKQYVDKCPLCGNSDNLWINYIGRGHKLGTNVRCGECNHVFPKMKNGVLCGHCGDSKDIYFSSYSNTAGKHTQPRCGKCGWTGAITTVMYNR